MGKQFAFSNRREEADTRKAFADFYANAFLTLEDGTEYKLGFFALSKEKDVEAQLIKFLEADPEGNAKKLSSMITFKCNSGTPKKRAALVLPDCSSLTHHLRVVGLSFSRGRHWP